MRIAAVIVGSILLTIAMGSYLRWATFARPLPPELPQRAIVTGVDLELTVTFEPQPGLWSSDDTTLIEVRSSRGPLVRQSEPVAALVPRRYRIERGLESGPQELWCAAYAGNHSVPIDPIGTPDVDRGILRGLRVRVGRNGVWWVDRTFWSIGDGAPAGTVRFEVPSVAASASHADSTDSVAPIARRDPL